jgi:hypothetical protein
MKYAWIENERIRDIAPGNPAEFYHADVALLYDTEVPNDATNGDGWLNGELVKPEPPPPAPPAPPAPRTWTVDNIRAGLTLSERVKWDNNSAPEVVTAKQETAFAQELEHTTEVLQMLVDAAVISQASMAKVLA